MHIEPGAVAAGAAVGLVVGLTGSGGGALLTPILILFLGVNARTAVGSDLVATMIMRPVAGAVHLTRRTVRWPIVGWSIVGSMPAAFLAGYISHWLISAHEAATVLSPVIGVSLLGTGAFAIARRVYTAGHAVPRPADGTPAVVIRPLQTALIGVAGGVVVGFTSVGSGTLMLVALSVIYPLLLPSELVGTDLVQAIPLVGAAALGHIVGGGLHISPTASIVIGGVPGALLGSWGARFVPERPLGAIVAGVIFLSGCALIGWMPGSIVGAAAALALGAALYRLRRAAGRGSLAIVETAPDEDVSPHPTR